MIQLKIQIRAQIQIECHYKAIGIWNGDEKSKINSGLIWKDTWFDFNKDNHLNVRFKTAKEKTVLTDLLTWLLKYYKKS